MSQFVPETGEALGFMDVPPLKYGGFHKNGWLLDGKSCQKWMNDLGVPLITPISGNLHVEKFGF